MGALRMNKKASVPVTILVIGVFAICGFALVSFFLSEFKLSNSFAMVDDLRALKIYEDEWKFYQNQGISESEILRKIKFPTHDYFNAKYKFEITLQGNEKQIKLSREYSDRFLDKVRSFFVGSKGNRLHYSIEYKFT